MASASARTNALILALAGLCAILLSIKYFPGVENSQYYAGLSLQAIHPEMLANDPAHGRPLSLTDTPYKLTAYYLLPRVLGEIWLDDRFIFPLYVLMVAACFLAADRMARLFGLSGLAERAIVQLLFMKDHQLIANKVIFAHDPDFHHSALSLPLSMWLLVIGLSGGGFVPLMALGGVLAAISMQVTPVNGILALALLAVGASPARRRAVWIMLALGLATLWLVLLVIMAPPVADQPELWRLLAAKWFKNMADPFNTIRDGTVLTWAWNLLFVALCAAALIWKGPDEAPLRRLRWVGGTALGLWLTAGLYVHFAPEAFQRPQLLLFPYARQLQAVQAVLYVGVVSLALRWAAVQGGRRAGLVAGLVVVALMLAGPGNYLVWCGLLGMGLLLAGGGVALRQGRCALLAWDGQKSVIAGSLLITVAVASAMAVRQRLPDFTHLARTGIHGGSSQAKWIGVAEYLRAKTPQGSVILPISHHENSRPDKPKLHVSRELASRSGRAVALPFLLERGLNLREFRWVLEQREIAFAIANAWLAGDRMTVEDGLEKLRPAVDYVVIPDGLPAITAESGFPFVEEARIGRWIILRRTKGHGTMLETRP